MEDTQRGTMIQLRLPVEGTWADQKIKLTKKNVQKYLNFNVISRMEVNYQSIICCHLALLRVKNQDYYYPIHGHMKTTEQ